MKDQYGLQNKAVELHPDRFFASYDCNPNRGMEEVRKIRRLKRAFLISRLSMLFHRAFVRKCR